MARAVLLTVQSFVLSAPIAVDQTTSQSDLDDELRDLLRRYLSG
jgi:hypothetical protein